MNATIIPRLFVRILTFSYNVIDETHGHPEVEEVPQMPGQLVEAG